MKLIRDTSVDDFLARAGALLYEREAANSLLLGVCAALVPRYLARVIEGPKTLTAAIQLPVRNLILTFASKEALALIAEDLFLSGIDVPGVVGPEREAEQFNELWTARTGQLSTLAMGQRIYQLDKVTLPAGVEGQLQAAQDSDADIVCQWFEEFADECLPENERQPAAKWLPRVLQGIREGYAYLWMLNGTPVSMVHAARPTKNGITVNAVYTPKNKRGKGFASMAVACLSQKMLDSGKKFCVLYTDVSNPTSNKIYQTVGYKLVSNSRYFQFARAPSARD